MCQLARVWSRCYVRWMLGSQLGSDCQEFQKGDQFVISFRKQNIVHQTLERIYTQNPFGHLPATVCQEPRSTRVYGAEKRNVIVAFPCWYDVKVPRRSVMGELLGDRKNVLSLYSNGMAQNTRTHPREANSPIQSSHHHLPHHSFRAF